ncbi:MAG: hypothetical protein ACR5LF_07985 [Symbiopectobacterium sp.]
MGIGLGITMTGKVFISRYHTLLVHASRDFFCQYRDGRDIMLKLRTLITGLSGLLFTSTTGAKLVLDVQRAQSCPMCASCA